MFKTKTFVRNLTATAAFSLLLGAPAFAQRAYDNNGYANRMVDGTVSSVSHGRHGDHVHLTNGMDVYVPNRVAVSQLQPGDVIRADVYSQRGDGHDAEARSVQILDSRYGDSRYDSRYNRGNYNYDRERIGTVVSVDRRNDMLVMQMDNGRTVSVDANGANLRGLRRGDRVSVTGRMHNGMFYADQIRGY